MERFTGTYLREPDGATLLMFSPHRFNDAGANYRNRRPSDGWRPVRREDVPDELWSEIEWLSPGEYLMSDGLVVEVGDL